MQLSFHKGYVMTALIKLLLEMSRSCMVMRSRCRRLFTYISLVSLIVIQSVNAHQEVLLQTIFI
jgi:hypothetical protein